jgi:hypothetical protein
MSTSGDTNLCGNEENRDCRLLLLASDHVDRITTYKLHVARGAMAQDGLHVAPPVTLWMQA